MSTGDADMDAFLTSAPAPAAAAPHSSGDSDVDAFINGTAKPDDKKVEVDKPAWRKTLDHYVGFQEGQLAGFTGGIGGLAGGLSYAGDRLFGKSDEEAQASKAKIQSDLTYEPRTDEGKKNAAAMSDAASYLGEKEGKAGGGATTDFLARHGASPAVSAGAGAAVETAANIPQYVAGEVLGKAFGKPKPIESPQPVLPPPRSTALVPSEPVPVVQATPVEGSRGLVPAAGPRVGQARTPAAIQAPDAAAPPAPAAAQPSAAAPAVEPPKPAQPPQKLLTFDQDQPFVEEKQRVSPEQQQQNVDVLRRVLGPNAEVRRSAITGDAQSAADEYQTSLANSQGGQHLANVIDSERKGLEAKADQITHEQGGTQGNPENQTVRTQRGNNIYAPLEALQDHFDGVTKAAYDAARAEHGTTPVKLDAFHEAMHDDSLMTDPDRVQLRSALDAFTNKLKVKQEDGSIAGNVDQAETIRKYLGKNWTPKNSGYVGALKDALEDDVSKAAGSDVFKAARAARTLKGQVFDDPKGMAQIMDVNGPNGINRKVYPEQIADKILSMPVPQMSHIVSTLEGVTDPKIKPMADKALAELRTHLVSKIGQEGKSTASLWNARGVTDELNNNSERVQRLLPKQTQDDLADLNDAGHLLKKRQGYPGAYIQEHNIVNKGMGPLLRGAGATAGSFIPGVGHLGAFGGEMLGGRLAGRLENAASLRVAKNRTTKLSDYDPNAR